MAVKSWIPSEVVAARFSSCAVAMDWLVRLRWHAVAGQTLTIVVASQLIDLPMIPLLAIVAASALSNLALARRKKTSPATWRPRHLVGVMALDTVTLTLLLWFSGGVENPFWALYLVNVTLAALVLRAREASLLGGLALAGFAALVSAPALPALDALHPAGLFAAFALAAALIGFCLHNVGRALRDRQDLLERARRLGAVSHLATSAAHQLNTPLGTIALAASELEALIEESPAQALEDARLIRDEVERCRTILQRLSARAGEPLGETPSTASAAEVLAAVRRELGDDAAARVSLEGDGGEVLRCPVDGLVQVLTNLVQNGLQAGGSGTVVVAVHGDRHGVRFVIRDGGSGIAPALRARLGEPFVTSKEGGMGLGVFLGRSFAELCGGYLEIESSERAGTRVVLSLPRGVAA
jgi:two-component system, sensor histidine kinase RegB